MQRARDRADDLVHHDGLCDVRIHACVPRGLHILRERVGRHGIAREGAAGR